MKFLKKVWERLREPSSWASLAVIFTLASDNLTFFGPDASWYLVLAAIGAAIVGLSLPDLLNLKDRLKKDRLE